MIYTIKKYDSDHLEMIPLPHNKIQIKTLDQVYELWIECFAFGSFGSFCDWIKSQGNIIY